MEHVGAEDSGYSGAGDSGACRAENSGTGDSEVCRADF